MAKVKKQCGQGAGKMKNRLCKSEGTVCKAKGKKYLG